MLRGTADVRHDEKSRDLAARNSHWFRRARDLGRVYDLTAVALPRRAISHRILPRSRVPAARLIVHIPHACTFARSRSRQAVYRRVRVAFDTDVYSRDIVIQCSVPRPLSIAKHFSRYRDVYGETTPRDNKKLNRHDITGTHLTLVEASR